VRRLDLGPQGGSVVFEERHFIDPATVVRLIQKSPREYRLEGPVKLRISRAMPQEEARFEFAADLMKRLGAKAQAK
jgi:transcription-repair coupling factor (superfamily II helicase)